MSEYTSSSTSMVMVALGKSESAVWVNVAAMEAIVPAGINGCKIHLASGVSLHLEDMTPTSVISEVQRQLTAKRGFYPR